MRISILEKREPFGKIFAQTMSEYWSNRLGQKIQVKYLDRNEKLTIQNDQVIFYGNIYLNNFSKIDSSSQIFEVVRKEYGRSNRKNLRLVQWLYVQLATSPYVLKWFAHRKLVINYKIEGNDFLLLGGNNRLRILKPLEKKSVIILKSGFSKEFLINEIELRSQYPLNFAPVLLNFSIEEGWIEESYTPGTPINRLSIEELKKYEKEAIKLATTNIVKTSLKKVEAYSHLKSLCNELKKYLDLNSLSNIFSDTIELLNKIDDLIENISIDEETLISWTHGDFQVANLLLQSSGDIVIIDWEAANYRSAFYDYITLRYNIRYNNDISDFVNQAINDNSKLAVYIASLDAELFLHNKTMVLHFLLDEFTYQIKNNCQKIFFNPYKEIEGKIQYYQKAIEMLS